MTLRAAVVLFVGSLLAPQGQVFRSSADAVVIDAWVRDGNAPVTTLTKADFLLTDNDVAQTIDDVTYDPGPVFLSLVVDDSVSVAAQPGVPAQIARAATALQASMGPSDRFEKVHIGRSNTFLADGGTSLLDALSVVLLRPGDPERRHLVVAVTDGIDTASLLGTSVVSRLAARADAVVHMVAVTTRRRAWARGFVAGSAVPSAMDAVLTTVVASSGGVLFTPKTDGDVAAPLQQALDDFRRHYVLRFSPTNAAPGWHTVRVGVTTNKKLTIRSRQGYEVRAPANAQK